MMARAKPSLALRPFLAADAPLLADIFRSSIADLTADDYSEAQQDAWASVADDEEEFERRLVDRLTLVATLDGAPIGFAALQNSDQIDMLYVHPAMAGQGVGTMLIDALERLAAARGTKRVLADASDNARAFFEQRGYVAQQRNAVSLGGEWLPNTTMEKKVAAKGSES